MLEKSKPIVTAPYMPTEVRGEWEFKVLASDAGAFRDPDVLRKVQAEEARAGWVLLEKLDDKQLRFKRPTSARAGDQGLPFDAYRTTYTESGGRFFFWLGMVTIAIAIFYLLQYLLDQ
ncbi:MAG: hypothetical protein ACJ74W_06275 [Pyrinomonadaceae bacterium]